MSSASFRFRHFEVFHDRCAMKVGTDGVLLGAWAGQPLLTSSQSIDDSFSILDIGTGSGLVALMLAQRFSKSHITAIDVEPSAVEQAQYNFLHSPWSDRLSAILSSLQCYQHPASFHLIVSNPPYFQNSLKNPDRARELARHTDSLSYSELVSHTARLLAIGGLAVYILPAEAESELLSLLRINSLFPLRILEVHSKPGKPAKRIMVEFTNVYPGNSVAVSSNEHPSILSNSRTTPEPTRTIFYIESSSFPRSDEYAALTQDFYL